MTEWLRDSNRRVKLACHVDEIRFVREESECLIFRVVRRRAVIDKKGSSLVIHASEYPFK